MNAEKSVTLKLEIKKLVEDVINELEDETIITPDEEDALDSAAKSSANDLKKFAKSLSRDEVQEARNQVNEVIDRATTVYQIATPSPQSILVGELKQLFPNKTIITEVGDADGYESVLMFNLSVRDLKTIKDNVGDVLVWKYPIGKAKSVIDGPGKIKESVNEVETKKQILNEAVGAAVVISILLAAPKALEIITKGMDRLVKTFKRSVGRKEAKTEEEQSELAKRIIKFSHDWHGFYVKIIQFILRISGVYRKANIDPKSPQAEKIAKVIFIVIVIGLGIYGGVQSLKHFYNAFKGIGQLGAEVGTGGLEAALTTIKGTEAKEFLSKII
jgi:Sec-independent protein translocase protein TatA